MHLPGVKAQAQKRVLVVLANPAHVGPAKPFQAAVCRRLWSAKHRARSCWLWFHFDGRFGVRQNGGELKIDQAKAPVGKPVGHVAHVGVVVPHAEFLQFGKQFLRAFRVQMLHPAAAVGGDDAELLFGPPPAGAGTKSQPRGFEMAQHPHLVGKPFVPHSARGRP